VNFIGQTRGRWQGARDRRALLSAPRLLSSCLPRLPRSILGVLGAQEADLVVENTVLMIRSPVSGMFAPERQAPER